MPSNLLEQIREVKKQCTSDNFDYEDGYGEICHLVFTALDIADELVEVVSRCHQANKRIVYGKDVPPPYSTVIAEQLERIRKTIAGGRQ